MRNQFFTHTTHEHSSQTRKVITMTSAAAPAAAGTMAAAAGPAKPSYRVHAGSRHATARRRALLLAAAGLATLLGATRCLGASGPASVDVVHTGPAALPDLPAATGSGGLGLPTNPNATDDAVPSKLIMLVLIVKDEASSIEVRPPAPADPRRTRAAAAAAATRRRRRPVQRRRWGWHGSAARGARLCMHACELLPGGLGCGAAARARLYAWRAPTRAFVE